MTRDKTSYQLQNHVFLKINIPYNSTGNWFGISDDADDAVVSHLINAVAELTNDLLSFNIRQSVRMLLPKFK